MKQKKVMWRVFLYGTLPCAGFVDVLAETEEAAKEQAEEDWRHAKWEGSTPSWDTVEIGNAELKQ